MIRKVKGGYRVLSEKKKRNMGTYKTKAGAEKRLKQIEMFKHMKGGKR
jgi:hypothetical protein